MRRHRGSIVSAIALGTGLIAAMSPAQALAAIPEGLFESHHVETIEIEGDHSAAITTDGSLYAWGFNQLGQVGDGTLDTRDEPVKIMDNVIDVAPSFSSTLALTEDGTVWAWGNNNFGQLGNGTTESNLTPIKVMEDATAVSAGFATASALGENGSLWMWGLNVSGNIGDGTSENGLAPTKIMEGVKQVSVGSNQTAAVAEDGSLWMWGNNEAGQLGNGTLENSLTPVRVLEGVEIVASGIRSTSAVTEDGFMLTWGENDRGQLGDGTTENHSTPVRALVGSTCPSEAFNDLDLTMWYHEAVDWALMYGAMNGYDNGTFGAEDPLAREQAAAVLWNLLGNGDATAPDAPHADVAQDAWYADAVNWAVENDYMNGYDGSDRFGVGDALTREQFVCVIANAAGADFGGIDPTSIDGFVDADAVSDWAAQAMAWAVSVGVITGVETEDGVELQPGRAISRAEMAAMIMNAVECEALVI